MERYAVWSESAGGFISNSELLERAGEDLVELVASGEDAEDLQVLAVCPDHDEQPLNGCEECDAEELDDEDEEA